MDQPWQEGDCISGRWQVHRRLPARHRPAALAIDEQSGQPVLLRACPPLDATAAARLQAWRHTPIHPHLCAAVDDGMHGKLPCVAVDFVPGLTLAQWLQQRSETCQTPHLLELAVQLCAGLSHLYRHGLPFHGALHPGNILISDEGHARLTDPLLTPDAPPRDEDLVVYEAPEARDDPSAGDARSDVYALGAVLHRMATGRPPPRGFTGITAAELRDDAIDRLGLPDGLPAPLRALIVACLARSPRDRPAGIEPIRRELAGQYEAHFRVRPPRPMRGRGFEAMLDYQRGLTLLGLERPQLAVRRFEQATRRHSRNALYWHYQGMAALLADQRDAAGECLEQAQRLDGESGPTMFARAMLLLDEPERRAEAARLFDSARHRGADPTRRPPDGEAATRSTNATCLSCGERFTWGVVHRYYAWRWMRRAEALAAGKRYEPALAACNSVLGLEPQHVEAWLLKGELLLDLARTDEALVCFDMVIMVAEHCADAWAGKAAVLARRGRHIEALACFEKALRLGGSAILRRIDLGALGVRLD